MTQNNVKIAVTGGIGSGKSAVCKIIKDENFPVFSCDEVYAELLQDGKFLDKLTREFGSEILFDNGALDRSKLSEIVFKDSVALERLNKITHPKILEEVLKRAESQKLCFCEVPLLFEEGYEKLFDGVIVVLRDIDSRISSVMERDGVSRENVVLRLKSQFNYENCDFEKYYVIHNDGNLHELKQKTLEIIKKIQNKKQK